jgi:hypothetical protein
LPILFFWEYPVNSFQPVDPADQHIVTRCGCPYGTYSPWQHHIVIIQDIDILTIQTRPVALCKHPIRPGYTPANLIHNYDVFIVLAFLIGKRLPANLQRLRSLTSPGND